jgi:hypothetical protein
MMNKQQFMAQVRMHGHWAYINYYSSLVMVNEMQQFSCVLTIA